MGTATLNRQSPLASSRPNRRLGALIAACALHESAGLTERLHLLGVHLAGVASAPVLVTECVPGRLRRVAGVASGSSLSELARGADRGQVFATGLGGVRVAAGEQNERGAVADERLERILRDARAAHAATLVDCGDGESQAARVVLRRATHMLWAIPAVADRHDDCVAALANRTAAAREIVLACGVRHAARTRVSDLTTLAEMRGAGLVLMPAIDDLAIEAALDEASSALAGLTWLLPR